MMGHKMDVNIAGSGGGILESPLRDSMVRENAKTFSHTSVANISTSSAASMCRELDQTVCPDLGVSLLDVPNLMMILAGFNPL